MSHNKSHALHFIAIYTLLAICLVSLTAERVGGSSLHAATAPNERIALGPADSITLRDAEGQEISLQNSEQRIAWSSNKRDRVWAIGFVRIRPVLVELLQGRPAQEIVDLSKKMRDEYEAYMAEVGPIRKELDSLNAGDPRYQEVYRSYKELTDPYNKLRDEQTKKLDSLSAERMKALFAEVQSAVEIVAKRERIDIVFQVNTSDDGVPTGQYSQTMWDIALRTVLHYPEGADITDDLLEELLK